MEKTPRPLMGRYELGKLLGRGTFAKVYRARSLGTGEEVAIKIMDKDHLARSGAVQQQIMREIEIMRRVRHPHVVRIHEVMANRKLIYVVMELVRGGSVGANLVHRTGRGISESAARRVFQQLVSALDYCHSLGVYHRDIKPDNILLDAAGNIKVADFGLSALAGAAQREALLHTVCGTPMFIAPEVFLRCGYDGAKADVWACGVVLFALVAGRFPFDHKDDAGLYHRIRRCEYHCPSWFSKGLVGLVRRILCPDPARRISIAQIKENHWFKKNFKEIPRSLSEPELCDSDADSDSESMASSMSLRDLYPATSPMVRPMHTSVSAPSLITLESNSSTVHVQPHMRRLKSLNAFDIIASSPSLDLSGLFEEPSEQMRFVSAAPVSEIVSKLEEIAGNFSFTARTKEYQVTIEETRNGNQGVFLISAKIFELSPGLVMVKVCKKAGDTARYLEFCNNELKPGLCGLIDGLPEKNAECMTSSPVCVAS